MRIPIFLTFSKTFLIRRTPPMNLENETMVDVSSRRGIITAKLKVSSKAVDGTIFIPFHFAKAAANKLTNAKLDPTAKIPEFKVCAIKLEKSVA